jgi:AraC-like DNA-binding protein
MSAAAIAAAIALESAAVWRLALSGSSTGALLVFLALHAAASALLALMLLPLLPARLRTPRTAVLALLFALAFFMPGLGAIALLLAVLAMRLAPVQVPVETFRLAAPPQFELSIPEPARRFRGLSVRQLLIDVNATAVLRSRALNAIAAKPARIAGDLLRRLLRDPVEDLRLVAYGLLDRQEKALRARIETQSRHLATLEASPLGRITLPGRIEPIDLDATRGELHRQLAELNHELVYQSLVQGDVREHTLAQAAHHVEAALEADPGDERSLADWAAQVHSTERTLARRCRRDLGMGFAEWRQRLRIVRALPRLEAGEKVASVALDLGYASASAFIAMFRRVTGATPREAGRAQPVTDSG